jgi:hypothetical protein
MVYDSLILTVSTVCPYVTCAIPHFKSISATLVAIRITCFNITTPCILSAQCKCKRRINLRIKVTISLKRICRQNFVTERGYNIFKNRIDNLYVPRTKIISLDSLHLRSSIFWDIMQCRSVVSY